MFRRRVSTLGLFVRDTRGNVAMIFSLCVLGIFGLSGLAIDYSRQQSMNTKLQSVADNVALSLARESRTKSAVYIQQRADELLAAALANSNITAGSIKTTLIDGAIPRFKVDVVGKIDSTFGGIFGVSKLNVDAAASVPILVPKLEVALVLDNTGSMNGQGKLSELKDAATSLVSILTDSSSKYAADAKIAIVPFAKDVNIWAAEVKLHSVE